MVGHAWGTIAGEMFREQFLQDVLYCRKDQMPSLSLVISKPQKSKIPVEYDSCSKKVHKFAIYIFKK